MEYLAVIIFAALVFGLCFLVDKGFTKLFRNQAQHHSGQAVRLNKKYGFEAAFSLADSPTLEEEIEACQAAGSVHGNLHGLPPLKCVPLLQAKKLL